MIRRPPDRPLMAHGPIIRRILWVQSLALVVAVAALILAFVGFERKVNTTAQRIEAVQASRQQAQLDTCRELQTLIRVATPPSRKAQGEALIVRGGLSDCSVYAERLVGLPPRH